MTLISYLWMEMKIFYLNLVIYDNWSSVLFFSWKKICISSHFHLLGSFFCYFSNIYFRILLEIWTQYPALNFFQTFYFCESTLVEILISSFWIYFPVFRRLWNYRSKIFSFKFIDDDSDRTLLHFFKVLGFSKSHILTFLQFVLLFASFNEVFLITKSWPPMLIFSTFCLFIFWTSLAGIFYFLSKDIHEFYSAIWICPLMRNWSQIFLCHFLADIPWWFIKR